MISKGAAALYIPSFFISIPAFFVGGIIIGSYALAGIFLFFFMIAFFKKLKWNIYPYRIVTNERVALVITSGHLFSSPQVLDSNFQIVTNLLAHGNFKISEHDQDVTTFFARVEYEGREGSGTAIINSIQGVLEFGRVSNIEALESTPLSSLLSFLFYLFIFFI